MKEDNALIKRKENRINSEKFKRFLFLEFTKELIRNYSPEKILRLKNLLEEERKSKLKFERTKIKVKEIIEKEKEAEKIPEEMFPSIIKGKDLFFIGPEEEIKAPPKKIKGMKPRAEIFKKERALSSADVFRKLKLIIPETRLPQHLQYIRPIPMNKEIELGNLNQLIKDHFVKIIECYGPGQNIIVRGDMGAKKTHIILSKEEITEIIKKFSEETKIPASEGIFKVVLGRLIFLAIISEILGSKFIIRKMLYGGGAYHPSMYS